MSSDPKPSGSKTMSEGRIPFSPGRSLLLELRPDLVLSNGKLVFLAAALVVALHIGTLLLTPAVWLDETMIMEYGRLLWQNPLDWSSVLNADNQIQPEIGGICYLGYLLHNSAYLLGGAGGPRLLALLSLALLGIAVFHWIRKLSGSIAVANFCALLVLFDPLLTQSVRGGRCDAEAILLWVCAILLLESAGEAMKSGRPNRYWLWAAAGAVFSVAFFLWITIFSATLFIAAYAGMIFLRLRLPWKKCLLSALAGGLGAAAAAGLLLLLYPGDLGVCIRIMPETIRQGSSERAVLSNLEAFLLTSLHSPVLFLSGILVFFSRWRYRWLWLIAYLAVCGLLFRTMIYVHRLIYQIPFGLLFLSALISEWGPAVRRRRLVCAAGAVYLLLLFGYTVCGRNLLAVWQHTRREPQWITAAFQQSELGANPDARIFVEPVNLYYIGRELGWRQFHRRDQQTIVVGMPYDYVILNRNSPAGKTMTDEYRLLEIIHSPHPEGSVYGAFELWKRKK